MANEELYEDDLETLTDDEFDEHEHAGEEQAFHEQHLSESHWQDEAGEDLDEQDFDVDAQRQDEPQAQPHGQPPEPLDQLPMALTVRCGSLNLTLGDLRRIAAGTVLPVSDITPGYATLCHGERVVAEGELVDVDGRLGLQITRMASPT
jgi:type III secretion protein Q